MYIYTTPIYGFLFLSYLKFKVLHIYIIVLVITVNNNKFSILHYYTNRNIKSKEINC